MSVNTTSRLGLHIWNEDEIVDFDEFNENFKNIDKLHLITESGSKTANTTGGTNNIVSWYYRLFIDGTIDMYCKLDYDTLKCNVGSAAPYTTQELTVTFPFSFTEIRDVRMSLKSSETKGWVFNVTEEGVLNKLAFVIGSFTKEESNGHKTIYISLKGKAAVS